MYNGDFFDARRNKQGDRYRPPNGHKFKPVHLEDNKHLGIYYGQQPYTTKQKKDYYNKLAKEMEHI